MEEILIRDLPDGTKAALRARAAAHHRSLEAEARLILAEALVPESVTVVDLLGTEEGADFDFTPDRLGLGQRIPED